ncbi:DUF4974 domain-containing protein [Carboxylicivirga mesophila]|uniref:DUF4974 domain-containing protein n=1 Tax=Carboxylicivirga mesophila TaxID=1166478 RepID=A0ABS5KDS1_9BACT|nr:FecR domain-containing protein [Carboxylicivirga mesophila]MBS2212671.1 DUF4974 domain-containing protein [Carboxylicivirga mesophila]
MKQEEEILQLISQELLNENTVEESLRLKALMSDSKQKRQYDVVKRFWSKGHVRHDSVAVNRIYNRVVSGMRDERIIWKKRQNLFLKIAASVLLLLSGSLLYLLQKDTQQVSMERYSTAFGETKEIILPDSSRVVLNAASTILYPGKFSKDSRDVVLVGEASFDISKDRNKPFRVETSHLQVEVLGTEFILSAYQEDETITTYLKEGSVRLNGEFADYQSLEMRPSQKAILRKEDMHMEVINSLKQSKSWEDGYMVFEQTSLKEIAARLERRFGVEIIIEDEALNNYKYSGSFRNENLFEILGFLSITKPFKFVLKNNTIVMSKE